MSANIEIVRLILSELGKSESLIRHVQDRPGHDRRYAIDNTKITTTLGWAPEYTFQRGMHETIRWYLENQKLGGACHIRRLSRLLQQNVRERMTSRFTQTRLGSFCEVIPRHWGKI